MSLQNHLHRLPIFIDVVKKGSIRKSAMANRLSQPAVSRSIKLLEEGLGSALLHRSKQGIFLTAAGQQIFNSAEKILKELRDVEIRLQPEQDETPLIKIGAYDSVAVYLLPNFIREFKKRYPTTEIEIVCGRSAELLKLVEDEKLDFAICSTSNLKKIKTIELYTDQYGFYVAKNPLPLAKLSFVSLYDAKDIRGKTIASYLKDFFGDGASLIKAPSFEVARATVAAGLGVGVLPTKVAEYYHDEHQLTAYKLPRGIPNRFGDHSFSLCISAHYAKNHKLIKTTNELFKRALQIAFQS